MLEPWALAHSAWKKGLFRRVVEDRNLRSAACIHALCGQEAQGIRTLGFGAPIAVIPNGIDLEGTREAGSANAFPATYPEARGRRIILFLGRIHPKKGLPHLLDAWAELARKERSKIEGWLLVIAGPDQMGHTAGNQARARALGISNDVLFTGPLYGDAKRAVLAAASGFVLPSFSEGFSMAILEAMAWHIPVLVTRQCNLDVESLGAGFLAEPSAASVSEQLRRFLALGDKERRRMGERGRKVVEERYTWPTIARQMTQAYEWVLGGGQRPDCIEAAR
jgi:poly(glycerol-phosphate) alpha-glucosyltransferase